MNRRVFLQGAAAAAAAAAAKPSWALGANDRIRVAIVGTGIRGNEIMTSWLTHKDTEIVALCDVAKDRLEKAAATLAAAGGKAETFGDYRRILERKDVDAVVVATPDHWHGPITVEACQAGKDVYCEKPVAHRIAPMFQMLDAARKHERVVQVGLQQRAWPHFQEAARAFREIGPVNHVVMAPPGGGPPNPNQPPPSETPEAPPATLDWEMFQGPAPRKPFAPLRLRWRGYYDYGGGNISDWGVHLVDVMNWFLGMDETLPLVVQGSAQYVRTSRNPERVPDTYSVTLQYDKMIATLSNAALFGPKNEPWWGDYFFGDKSLMLVNRDGFEVRNRPLPRPADGSPAPETPPATAFGFGDEPVLKMTDVTAAHVRDFLDCMRSRKRPKADIAIGVNSTLPTLLAVESVKAGGRAMKWDAAKREAVAL